MSKALRTVGMVVGAVALVAATAGLAAPAVAATATTAASAGGVLGVSAATLAAIGTYGSLAAGVLSMAAQATAPGFSAEGSATTFQTNPQSGLPYAMGRTRMSGLRVYARTYDGFKQQSKDDILAFVALLSIAGPIHSIEKFTADNELVTFAPNGDANGRFYRYMAQSLSLGNSPGSALALQFGGKPFPEWGANHRLNGITHAQWALRFDTDGNLYGAGAPEPAWVGKWVKVYDPRKDSTYPGGSGPHRALNEATYEWSDNPGLHALTWALGRWQNGKRVCGIGAPVANIRVAEFVECANVCDANGWKVGGAEWTTDSKWDTLKRILQAGGAIPTQTGAMIGCLTSTPRTAIATIESRHLLDGLSLAATKSRRDRFNTVIPRYVDEDSDWAVISGTAVTEPVYVTDDGGQRTKEIDFPLVQVFSGEEATQPGQLAAYAIVNSREAGPFTWTTGPEWIGLKTGDVVYLNVPEEGLVNQPVLITRRAPDPATGKVSFAGETETYSKHAYALGQSTTPPAPFSLTAPDLKPAAPEVANWSVSGATSGEGFPALLVAGQSEMPSADSVIIGYRKTGDEAWISSAILSAVGPVSHTIAPLASETAYDVRIAYRVGTIHGNTTIFTNVITGLGKLTIIEQQQTDIDAELAQLEVDTAAAALAIAAAETTITNMQADAAAVQAALTQAHADILSAQEDILANGEDIETIETTLGQHGAAITSLQTTASNQAGQLAALASTVSTQSASITFNSTAITTLQGSVASLATLVSAGSPNLLPNGGFENGLAGWTGSNGVYSKHLSNSWGSTAYSTTNIGNGSYTMLQSNNIPVWLMEHTLTADSAFSVAGGAGVAYVEINWIGSDGVTLVGQSSGPARPQGYDFTLHGEGRSLHKLTASPPSGASFAKVNLVARKDSGTLSLIAWRQVKFEAGGAATAYTPEAQVAQTAQAVTTVAGQYATLSTTVSTQGSSITTLQSSMTTAQANIAALQSTVATQGASITSNATAITDLQGNLGTLTTKVSAGIQPNLLKNPTFENGLADWGAVGAGWFSTVNGGWGSMAGTVTSPANGAYIYLQSSRVPAFAGVQFTLASDCALIFSGGSAIAYTELNFYDSGDNLISQAQGAIRSFSKDFDVTGEGRAAMKVTATSPANTAYIRASLVCRKDSGTLSLIFWRQVKLEYGGSPTFYSSEASIAQTFSALSTLTTQYASLSSTVSTQGVTITSQQTAITTINGNITTLFGRAALTVDVNGRITGYEINNNGTVGSFTIRSDRFRVLPPSGTTDGFYIDIDGSNRTTQYIRSGSVRVVELGWLS
ncbi:hypothetical protein TomMM35A_18700 [Sphingobium sp. TomMM35A]